MRVMDVMRSSLATVKPGTPVLEAARLLLETNQRGLPVLDDDEMLVGIISEGDFLHRDEILGIEEATPARERMRALRVGEIMTLNPVFVTEDASVEDAVADMDLRNVAQIPVVSAGKVVGLISRFELIAALERRLSQSEPAVETAK